MWFTWCTLHQGDLQLSGSVLALGSMKEIVGYCWIFNDPTRGDKRVLSPLCSHLSPPLPVSDLEALPETKSLWQTLWKDFTHKTEIRESFSVSLPTQPPHTATAAFRSQVFIFPQWKKYCTPHQKSRPGLLRIQLCWSARSLMWVWFWAVAFGHIWTT